MNLFGDDEPEEEDAPAEPQAPARLAPARASRLLIGHEEARAQLSSMAAGGRLPHGLILSGPRGIGKATAAFALARFLLSGAQGTALDAPPGNSVYGRVAAGGEPDLLTVKREEGKASLGVDAVRKIAHFAHHTAAKSGGWRVVVVDDADIMTRAAQNALLKVLEEPPPRAALILVTHRLGALLPTVRSRAAVIPFHALGEAEMARLLALSDAPPAPQDMPLLTALSGGSPGLALDYARSGAAELWAQVEPMLRGPADWPAAHRLAEQMAGKAAGEAYRAFTDLVLWHFRAACHAAPGDTGALARHDALAQHFAQIERGTLDPRQGVLGAFMILDSGAKSLV